MVAEARVDILGCHAGLTGGGLTEAEPFIPLDESIKLTNGLIVAAKEVRPKFDFLAITHGGPIEDPKTTAYVLECTEAVGYIGASSTE